MEDLKPLYRPCAERDCDQAAPDDVERTAATVINSVTDMILWGA